MYFAHILCLKVIFDKLKYLSYLIIFTKFFNQSSQTMYSGLLELELSAVVSGKSNINKNTISMDDVEKRKSFADMKLVDFTSGSGSIEVIKSVKQGN